METGLTNHIALTDESMRQWDGSMRRGELDLWGGENAGNFQISIEFTEEYLDLLIPNLCAGKNPRNIWISIKFTGNI